MRAEHHPRDSFHPAACPLLRRGHKLGWVRTLPEDEKNSLSEQQHLWRNQQAVPLPSIDAATLDNYSRKIQQAEQRMASVVEGVSHHLILPDRCTSQDLEFFLTSISGEEHDPQGIVKLYYQAFQEGQETGEIWCKLSWLSFHEEDASLRFRFSFGVEGVEDVASDPVRQQSAAELCQTIFPESALITENPELQRQLHAILDMGEIAFVERIVYFNAPNGGALFHHDVEPGHVGVIYAQISGSTFWLALPKRALLDEIEAFITRHPVGIDGDRNWLSTQLDRPEHPELEEIIDHHPDFIHQLAEHGYAHILHPGEILLLPQKDEQHCAWHSVISLGDEPGEGLSFAMRQATT